MIECFFRFSSTFRRWSISCTSRRCPASVASAPLSPTWPPSGPSARRTPSTTTTGWQDWSCNFKISLLLLTYDWLHPTFLRAGAQPMKFSFFFAAALRLSASIPGNVTGRVSIRVPLLGKTLESWARVPGSCHLRVLSHLLLQKYEALTTTLLIGLAYQYRVPQCFRGMFTSWN